MVEYKPNSVDDAHFDLAARVDQLQRFFNVSRIVNRRISAADIVTYYKQSSIGYSLVHSRDGSIHMSLSRDGQYDPEGYHAQVDIVSKEIDRLRPLRVLELGCGRGYNLARLASSWPKTEFFGIDLSSQHVAMARKETKGRPNVHIQVGDFEALPTIDYSFGLAYSIESLCHARNFKEALCQAAQVVSPGGELLVIDAWRTDETKSVVGAELAAITMIERSMAVGEGTCFSDWKRAAVSAGWRLQRFTNLSHEAMPNLERFERLANGLLRRPALAHAVKWFLPGDLTNNVIAGYLMAQSVRQILHVYGFAVLSRVE